MAKRQFQLYSANLAVQFYAYDGEGGVLMAETLARSLARRKVVKRARVDGDVIPLTAAGRDWEKEG